MVDLPVLSNVEQCADACMRLKAEYLYQTRQYNKIKFQDVNGQSLGASREPFTAISVDSMVLPAPSHPAARCSLVHWQISNPVTSLSTLEMVDFLVMPSSSSTSPSIRMGKNPFSSPKAIHRLATFTSSATLKTHFAPLGLYQTAAKRDSSCPLLFSKQLTWDTIERKGKKSQLRW